MTTLNSLGGPDPESAEVWDASLAMADYDAKAGDYATALEWLAVAAQFRSLTPEYRRKKVAWQLSLRTYDAAPRMERARRRGVEPGCGAAVDPPIERGRRAQRPRGRRRPRDG
jgi:hypothetical protein